ncbi:hypothetical protein Tco_0271261 [Tanacetum coccineum]
MGESTGYWQEPDPHESPVEAVATSPLKTKKPTRAHQKRMIQNDNAPWQIAWRHEEEIVLAKARDAAKKKRSRASGYSSMNDDALARLIVTEMTTQEKEQREVFLEIKRRDVECREREIIAHEYRQRQEDIRFYLRPYDHLTGEQQMAMDEVRAEIKAKYNLPYLFTFLI